MEVSFTLTEKDFLKGVSLPYKKLTFILDIIFSIFLIVIAFIAYLQQDIIPFIAIYGLYLFLIHFMPTYQAKKQYRQLKMFQDKVILKTTEDGIYFEHIVGSIFLKWEAFMDYRCEPSLCVLHVSSIEVQVIPFRDFSEKQKSEFRTLLENKIPAK